MRQQPHQQVNLHIVQEWEKQLSELGHFADESFLLSSVRLLDEQKDAHLMASILVLAAQSRMEKYGHEDHLAIKWMEYSRQLDPGNEPAMEFLAQFDWQKKESLLDNLEFPTIRETDNRAAKKSVAEQIISICQHFIAESDDEIEKLEKGYQLAYRFHNHRLLDLYRDLISIMEEVLELVGKILKAAEEYDQSIAGVFHTAVHFQDVRTQLDELPAYKERWRAHFIHTDISQKQSIHSLGELNRMIGMHDVKERVHKLYQFLKYQKDRKQKGFQTKDEHSLDMIITGNPGTGKTTLVRLLANIYNELGILPRKEVIETDRSKLVGSFVGQTEENVRMAVEKAVGGVLFIDEAYSLKREGQSGNDYGQTAIDTLVSLMTSKEYGGKFAVVLAGYPEEMRQFLESNTGLRSRFPRSNHIHLLDYQTDELLLIAERFASDNDYFLTDEAKKELARRLELERVDETFGNARTVQTLVLDAIFKKGAQLTDSSSVVDYTVLDREDFYIETKNKDVSSHDQLQALIGLESIKEEVEKLISFVKVQRQRANKGLPTLPIQLHSVFTGNPGTGKTTVASIYAQALKECGFLKRGHVIVTSRADFVAGYVGQTAIKTKKKIREALGGVLFIDEAYSLISKSPGDFGKEMIDTLVDEMTKHNENLVVILAGYPKEMSDLLESNPGLQSRFKKFYHFPDYNTGELIEIMERYAAKFQYHFDQEAKNYLQTELPKLTIHGNGRFATNVIDESIQIQSVRVSNDMEGDLSTLMKEDVTLAILRVGRGE